MDVHYIKKSVVNKWILWRQDGIWVCLVLLEKWIECYTMTWSTCSFCSMYLCYLEKPIFLISLATLLPLKVLVMLTCLWMLLALWKQITKLNCVEIMMTREKNTHPYTLVNLSETLIPVRGGSRSWSWIALFAMIVDLSKAFVDTMWFSYFVGTTVET